MAHLVAVAYRYWCYMHWTLSDFCDRILHTIFVVKLMTLLNCITDLLFAFFLIPVFVRRPIFRVICAAKLYIIGAVCCLKEAIDSGRNRFDDRSIDIGGSARPVAIITGATSGIGLALCERLADEFTLILIGRDRSRCRGIAERMKVRFPTSQIGFYAVDLSCRRSVNEFLQIFFRKFDRLHLLINNAGVMAPPYTLCGVSGNIELQWAVNFLAPVYLTDRLRPCLRRASIQDGFARVINVGSAAMFAGKLSMAYLNCAGAQEWNVCGYSSHLAYANSKLALAAFVQQLAAVDEFNKEVKGRSNGHVDARNQVKVRNGFDRGYRRNNQADDNDGYISDYCNGDDRQANGNGHIFQISDQSCDEEDTGSDDDGFCGKNVPSRSRTPTEPIVCVIHPGIVTTSLYRNCNVFLRLGMRLSRCLPIRLTLTAEEAVENVLWACFSPEVKHGGYYEYKRQRKLPFVSDQVLSALRMDLTRQAVISVDGTDM